MVETPPRSRLGPPELSRGWKGGTVLLLTAFEAWRATFVTGPGRMAGDAENGLRPIPGNSDLA